ncbi:MAG: glycine--tRNA ligase subunit beta [Pseudomonadota bacterium]
MTTNNLLVELFVEELPPKALKKLGESFAELLSASLKAQGLAAEDAQVASYASPRRLGVHVRNVLAQAPDKSVSQKLMPVAVGLNANGQATPALLKKLAALGADAAIVDKLRREGEGRNEALFLDTVVAGAKLADGLQKALDETLARLPIPKVMTYQLADGWSDVKFVRPAHRLVALYGSEVVPVSVLGLTAGRETRGHRFEAKNPLVAIGDADSYAQQLRIEGAVIASFAERRAEIVRQIEAAAAKHGLKPIEDEALLDEVTALVERPNVLTGQFDEVFLEVPQECLILTMKANQKYFPLLDANGKLTNKFLIVSNIAPADASAVIGGNERVVRPRLADARFFFDQDRRKPLESRVPGLAKVVYHSKLGSQGERVERVMAIARAIGEKLGSEELALQADRAALLAKADLLTDMVGEFPELQGIMGRYYAQHDGLGDAIAIAIEDHYKPRFSGDELPRNDVGACVALADKLETLAGLFGIGQIPTGDKDPFALRRHALGVLRILIEKKLPLDLGDLVNTAFAAFPKGMLAHAHAELETFMFERLGGMMREQGYTANEVEAVLSLRPARIDKVPLQLQAVRAFSKLPEAASLAAANKRVGNILKKVEGGVPAAVNQNLLNEEAEKALYRALLEIKPKADTAFESGDYTGSLTAQAVLRPVVDTFFDDVMVNADDPALKANRLALLSQLHQTMNRVADLAKLAA